MNLHFEDLRGCKVLLTGRTGYVGGVLFDYLKKNGVYVVAAGRSVSDDVFFDLLLPDIQLSESFDVCIHCAAWNEVLCASGRGDVYVANVVATKNLLNECIRLKVRRFIYVSTFHVFGCRQGVLDEFKKPEPLTDYGMSHYFSEQLALLSNGKDIDVVVLRLPNVFGTPSDWKMFRRWSLAPFDFCLQAVRNKRIVLKSAGRVSRNFVSLDYVCQIVADIVASSRLNGLVHVPGVNLTLHDLAKMVSRNIAVCEVSELDSIDRDSDSFTFCSYVCPPEVDVEVKMELFLGRVIGHLRDEGVF